MTLKILNLYSGIGGNRKLWSGDIQVTAVELNPNIAAIYKDFFPNDEIIVADAHDYLLKHFEKYDFIWSSPPCPTHSQIRLQLAVKNGSSPPLYPDMKLYEEIILLQYYFKGKYCVENVNSFYDPLIKPQIVGRHYYWTNFPIANVNHGVDSISEGTIPYWEKKFGFDLSLYTSLVDKQTVLRNCVEPKTDLHILEMAYKKPQLRLQL